MEPVLVLLRSYGLAISLGVSVFGLQFVLNVLVAITKCSWTNQMLVDLFLNVKGCF